MHLKTLIASAALLTAAGSGVDADPARGAPSAATLSTVIVYTPDMAGLADFYQRALQLGEPATALDNHIGYWLGDNYLGFEPVASIASNPGGPTVWFAVDDIEAAFARMVDAGGRRQSPPTRQDFGGILATVLDPDGNVVGLIQETPRE